MQVTTLDIQQLADTLEQSRILSIDDLGSIRQYVLEFDNQDILVFSDGSNNSFVVYPPESLDSESGGSIHDHARAILQAEGNAVAA